MTGIWSISAARAVGGAGAVLTEAIAVVPEGRISPSDLGIWKDEHIENWHSIVRFLRHQGAVRRNPARPCRFQSLQFRSLARPGRTRARRRRRLAARLFLNPKGFTPESIQPEALTAEGIARVVQAFAAGARRSLDAGFELLEIHGAHGYLVHQFLSPLVNTRTDGYGGSFDNRTRLLREIIAAVRNVWPERLPLWLRISSSDWTEGGWTIDDSIALAKQVKPLGVDLIDASSGGIVPAAKISLGPGYQTAFAQRIRHEAGILSGAVGMITSPEQAQHIIATGQADLVLLAREFLRDPHWPLRAASVLKQQIAWPKQYERAKW